MDVPYDSFTVPVSISDSGANSLPGCQDNGNRTLIVLGGFLKNKGAGSVDWTVRSTGETALTGAIPLASGEGGPINVPIMSRPGEGIEIVLSAEQTVVGWLLCRWKD
jgi:hypothetical protein